MLDNFLVLFIKSSKSSSLQPVLLISFAILTSINILIILLFLIASLFISLTNLIESSMIEENGKVKATPLDGSKDFYCDLTDLVSMNMFCLRPDMIDYLDKNFEEFFNNNKDNLEKCEYLIPDMVFKKIKEDGAKVKVVDTNAVWHGVTYKEDKQDVVDSINELISKGEYPEKL